MTVLFDRLLVLSAFLASVEFKRVVLAPVKVRRQFPFSPVKMEQPPAMGVYLAVASWHSRVAFIV
jgi:hypothetical protein